MRKKFEVLFDIGNILGFSIFIFGLLGNKIKFGYFGVCIFFICELFQFMNNLIDRQNSTDLKYNEEEKFKKLDFNKLWEIIAYLSVVILLIANLEGGFYAVGTTENEKIILQLIELLIFIILMKFYYFWGFEIEVFDDGIIFSNGEWISYEDVSNIKVSNILFRRRKKVKLYIKDRKKSGLLYKHYSIYLNEDDIKILLDGFNKDTK